MLRFSLLLLVALGNGSHGILICSVPVWLLHDGQSSIILPWKLSGVPSNDDNKEPSEDEHHSDLIASGNL